MRRYVLGAFICLVKLGVFAHCFSYPNNPPSPESEEKNPYPYIGGIRNDPYSKDHWSVGCPQKKRVSESQRLAENFGDDPNYSTFDEHQNTHLTNDDKSDGLSDQPLPDIFGGQQLFQGEQPSLYPSEPMDVVKYWESIYGTEEVPEFDEPPAISGKTFILDSIEEWNDDDEEPFDIEGTANHLLNNLKMKNAPGFATQRTVEDSEESTNMEYNPYKENAQIFDSQGRSEWKNPLQSVYSNGKSNRLYSSVHDSSRSDLKYWDSKDGDLTASDLTHKSLSNAKVTLQSSEMKSAPGFATQKTVEDSEESTNMEYNPHKENAQIFDSQGRSEWKNPLQSVYSNEKSNRLYSSVHGSSRSDLKYWDSKNGDLTASDLTHKSLSNAKVTLQSSEMKSAPGFATQKTVEDSEESTNMEYNPYKGNAQIFDSQGRSEWENPLHSVYSNGKSNRLYSSVHDSSRSDLKYWDSKDGDLAASDLTHKSLSNAKVTLQSSEMKSASAEKTYLSRYVPWSDAGSVSYRPLDDDMLISKRTGSIPSSNNNGEFLIVEGSKFSNQRHHTANSASYSHKSKSRVKVQGPVKPSNFYSVGVSKGVGYSIDAKLDGKTMAEPREHVRNSAVSPANSIVEDCGCGGKKDLGSIAELDEGIDTFSEATNQQEILIDSSVQSVGNVIANKGINLVNIADRDNIAKVEFTNSGDFVVSTESGLINAVDEDVIGTLGTLTENQVNLVDPSLGSIGSFPENAALEVVNADDINAIQTPENNAEEEMHVGTKKVDIINYAECGVEHRVDEDVNTDTQDISIVAENVEPDLEDSVVEIGNKKGHVVPALHDNGRTRAGLFGIIESDSGLEHEDIEGLLDLDNDYSGGASYEEEEQIIPTFRSSVVLKPDDKQKHGILTNKADSLTHKKNKLIGSETVVPEEDYKKDLMYEFPKNVAMQGPGYLSTADKDAVAWASETENTYKAAASVELDQIQSVEIDDVIDTAIEESVTKIDLEVPLEFKSKDGDGYIPSATKLGPNGDSKTSGSTRECDSTPLHASITPAINYNSECDSSSEAGSLPCEMDEEKEELGAEYKKGHSLLDSKNKPSNSELSKDFVKTETKSKIEESKTIESAVLKAEEEVEDEVMAKAVDKGTKLVERLIDEAAEELQLSHDSDVKEKIVHLAAATVKKVVAGVADEAAKSIKIANEAGKELIRKNSSKIGEKVSSGTLEGCDNKGVQSHASEKITLSETSSRLETTDSLDTSERRVPYWKLKPQAEIIDKLQQHQSYRSDSFLDSQNFQEPKITPEQYYGARKTLDGLQEGSPSGIEDQSPLTYWDHLDFDANIHHLRDDIEKSSVDKYDGTKMYNLNFYDNSRVIDLDANYTEDISEGAHPSLMYNVQTYLNHGRELADGMFHRAKWLVTGGFCAKPHTAAMLQLYNNLANEDSVVINRESEFKLLGTKLLQYNLSEEYAFTPNTFLEFLQRHAFRVTGRNICSDRSKRCNSSAKYRSYDGSCNNVQHSTWGKCNTAFSRISPPRYSDGIHSPPKSVTGSELPNVRILSTNFFAYESVRSVDITLALTQWSQILSHDFALQTIDQTAESGIECCADNGKRHLPKSLQHHSCLPIDIPPKDEFYSKHGVRCMNFVRSMTVWREDCTLGSADQLNTVTSYLDCSPLYGSEKTTCDKLRAFERGLMKEEIRKGQHMLPTTCNATRYCDVSPPEVCYQAGDVRANQNPQLAIMHTLLLREHNRIAIELASLNPHWHDELIFQETRRIVIAVYQHITYSEWLPIVIGKNYCRKQRLAHFGPEMSKSYDPHVNAATINGFTTGAFRFFHSIVEGNINLCPVKGDVSQTLRLSNYYFRPQVIEDHNNFEELLRGLITQPAQKADTNVHAELSKYLFRSNNEFGMDLVAIDIQRSRDHGLQGYNAYRKICRLGHAKDFDDLVNEISHEKIEKLKKIYAHVDDIDLLVGASLEKRISGSLLGPTLRCLISEQFFRSRIGDRYFYNNADFPHSFTQEQFLEIRKASLARLLCSTGNLSHIQRNPFKQTSRRNPLVLCKRLPKLNLALWKELRD